MDLIQSIQKKVTDLQQTHAASSEQLDTKVTEIKSKLESRDDYINTLKDYYERKTAHYQAEILNLR